MSGSTTLVTGASGPLGAALVRHLLSSGRPVRGMARGGRPAQLDVDWARADLLSGEGLAAALRGVGTVVHCASNARRPDEDLGAIDQLLAALHQHGPARLIYIGIAGIELAAANLPYYGIKLEVERRIAASGLPHAIVRATQFHPFVEFILSKLDLKFAVIVPRGVVLQPVSLEHVASRLADHSQTTVLGRLPDIHGPQPLSFRELAESWLLANQRRPRILAAPMPMPPFNGLARLQEVSGDGGGASWVEWLATRGAQRNPYL